MKKVVFALVLLFQFGHFCSAQEGNRWSVFFERAITLNENDEYEEAEEQFRKAQQSLLEEFGLNEITHATYCNILFRRAENLFLLDGLQDSSYVCFKELYDLSKSSVDSVSGEWFRTESTIMLSTIYLNEGKIRECCELLENEKQRIDKLDLDTRLPHKYYFYKNLAKTYEYLIVNLLPGRERDYNFLNSQYVIVRDGAFYPKYIAVFEELTNLSIRFNRDNIQKMSEDYLLLASHCRIPDDDYLAYKTFERAFSLWNNSESQSDMAYLKLCKGYLTYRNNSVFHLPSAMEQKIVEEFDGIITSKEGQNSLSYIDLMDFFSVRLQDKLLENPQKEVYVKELCNYWAEIDNYLILYFVCGYSSSDMSIVIVNNIKILIKYLSLSSIFYYELGKNSTADLLLNKARFFSLFLPDGDRLLLEDLNNAIARSAESIGDKETYYAHKATNVTCKVAKGVIPTSQDILLIMNHGDVDSRIANLKNGIDNLGLGKYDKDLLDSYINLADACFESNNSILAEDYIAIADSIIQMMMSDGKSVSRMTMSNLLLCKAKSAYCIGDLYDAIIFARKAVEKCGNIEAVELLTEISADDKSVLDSIVVNQFHQSTTFILESFPFLSEKERITFSQNKEFQWYMSIPRYADRHPQDTTLLSIAYNSALISKGANISVSTAIINAARGSDENTTKEALNSFIKHSTENVNETSERVRENQKFYLEVLEKEMQRSSEVTPQYLSEYFGDWRNISNQLSDKEVAIEFVEFIPLGEPREDDLYLGALYLAKSSNPHFLRICKVAEIDLLKKHIEHDGLQGMAEVYNIIWQPIIKEYRNVNRVWFAPSVHLFQTNIESALPDSIDAYRVSSTRNILTLIDTPDYSEIALFGGLNYDDKDTLIINETPNLTAYNIIRGSNIDEERVGLKYLKGSLNEVITAQTILSTNNHSIQTFFDRRGTEERFKSLSGTGISLLHIATHGFYIKNDDNVLNVGYGVMRKTGLFMSGAKAIWKGVNEKYTGDDGILLSEEVENLDFSKLNLVVLSACGTGLGNPTNDGVYGLQRAFKKAGAQTIIMSLWNVDDNATALMMETFYQELVKTNSKHQAFRKAQEAVREKYENPYYWAAFIMLD